MKKFKEEILLFIEELKESYFVKRDIEGFLSYMLPEVSCMGTGKHEVFHNVNEVRQALEMEKAEYAGSFAITQEELKVEVLCEEVGCVYGIIVAEPEDRSLDPIFAHITLICLKKEQGLRVLHCNYAQVDYLLEEGRFFAPSCSHADNQMLQEQLAKREKELKDLVKNIPGGAHRCADDTYFTIINMSDSFVSLFGFTKEEIQEKFDNRFIYMLHPDDRERVLLMCKELTDKEPQTEFEYRAICKNGEYIWILDKALLVTDEEGEKSIYCILVEITKKKQAQEELRLSLEKHQIIMDQATDIIFEWNIDEDKLIFSSNWKKKFGYEAICNNISHDIPRSENIYPEDRKYFVEIMQNVRRGVPYAQAEFRIRNSEGIYRWHRIRVTTQFDGEGRSIKAIGVIFDIEDAKQEKEELLEMAQKDALTGLNNKQALKTKIDQIIKRGTEACSHALLIIDIDNFKNVNDTYGHLCGDRVLSDMAATLKRFFRATDVIGRIGGDEFLVFLPEMSEKDVVLKKAEKLLLALHKVKPKGSTEYLRCSIGATISVSGEADYLTLYNAADMALYQQKKNGKDGVAFYDAEKAFCAINEQCSAIGDEITAGNDGIADDRLARYIFRTLYQVKNWREDMPPILEIIGRAFDVSRVYVIEVFGVEVGSSYEWVADKAFERQSSHWKINSKTELSDYMQYFNTRGTFFCENVEDAPDEIKQIATENQATMFLQCTIMEEDELRGIIGFDECRTDRHWMVEQWKTMELIANALATFISKFQMAEKIKKWNL